ncbi:MAG: hypothetical protein Kow0069_16470 [Promethearchaeota archaeon]
MSGERERRRTGGASPPIPITRPPGHHFFGYYDVNPWDAGERHHLALAVPFQDRVPTRDDPAAVGVVDPSSGRFAKFAETHAWNFQQGAMLHWLPSDPSRLVVFNDEHPGGFLGARVVDVETGKTEKWLERPVAGLFHRKDAAASLNYARVGRNRPVVGYPQAKDFGSGGPHPEDDGLFVVDLETGDAELVASLDDVWNAHPHTREMTEEEFSDREFWINHAVVSPDDRRVLFLARYATWLFGMLETSMWTVGVDGRDLRCVVTYQRKVSHFGWAGPDVLASTFLLDGRTRHVFFRDRPHDKAEYHAVAPHALQRDGHPALHPGGRHLLTDCYPDRAGKRRVYLVDLGEEGVGGVLAGKTDQEVMVVHEFDNPAGVRGRLRCDPHPRWSGSGSWFSFDAIAPDGTRQLFAGRFGEKGVN